MQRNSMDEPVSLRIVLVGKTGSGKSSAGNTILGRECFEIDVSPVSVTKACERGEVMIDDQIISVIDTPGLFDTKMSEEEMKNELVRCVEMSVPSPHAFLLVIRLGVRFTDEEKNTVKWIQENFGEEAVQYTIVLFTHADTLEEKPLDEYISKSKDLQALVNECSGRFHSFNNKNMRKHFQVTELLQKIGEMVKRNRREHYTNEMYEQAQKNVEHEAFKQKLKDYGKTALRVIIARGGEVVATTAGEAVAAAATEGAAAVVEAVAAAATEGAAAAGKAVAAAATEGGAAVVREGAATTVNIATEATTAVVLTGRAAIFSAVGGAAVVVARGVGKGVVTAARLAGGPAATAVRVVYGGAAALAAKFRP